MKIFLDTNVIIDLVADRQPFAQWAFKIFEEQKKGRWTLYTTSNSILTTYYISEKAVGSKKALGVLSVLLKRLEIRSISKDHLLTAMHLNFTDYEDAVLHQTAVDIDQLDYIITRNKKDFKHSKVTVLSSEELFINL